MTNNIAISYYLAAIVSAIFFAIIYYTQFKDKSWISKPLWQFSQASPLSTLDI